jgi:hypothetical protein
LHIRLPLQQLLVFSQRQMIEEGIASIDEPRNSALSDISDNARVLVEINSSAVPGASRQGWNSKNTIKR